MLNYLQDPVTSRRERGDKVRAVRLPGRRVTLSRSHIRSGDVYSGGPTLIPTSPLASGATALGSVRTARGFTLIELVITITVLTILTLGVVPLMQVSVKRQKEQQLRDALRQMRSAIDDFRRDTVAMRCTGLGGAGGVGSGGVGGGGVIGGGGQGGGQGGPTYIDPRSKVVISDCTMFGVDNPDRYPPDLETLVSGVNVIPRAAGLGGRGDLGIDATKVGEISTKKKVYLRAIPVDPMTGEASWDFCSCYDEAKCDSWGGENVFDVRSKSKGTALNGEQYSDW
jgi:general secretion pathway protein G